MIQAIRSPMMIACIEGGVGTILSGRPLSSKRRRTSAPSERGRFPDLRGALFRCIPAPPPNKIMILSRYIL